LKTKAKADSESLAKATKEIEALELKAESIQKQLTLAQEGFSATSTKLQALEAKSSEDEKALETAKADVAKAKQEVVSLQQMMDTFDAENRSKDELHRKVKAELAATVKSLEDKTKEISTLQQKHQKELQTVSNDYEKEIEALQGNSGIKEEYEALRIKHEELTKAHTDAIEAHARDMEKLKQNHAAAIVALDDRETAHQKTLEELKTTYAKNLDEAHDKAITAGDAAHAIEIEQLQASHAEAIATLKKQHAAIQASVLSDAEKHKVIQWWCYGRFGVLTFLRPPRQLCRRKSSRRILP
jgi:chromosome segregation ATPase